MCGVCVSVVCIYFRYLSCMSVLRQCFFGLYPLKISEVCVCCVSVYGVCFYFKYLRAFCLVSVCLCYIFINIYEV